MQARYDSVPVHLHFIMCHANTESITKRSQRSRMFQHLTQKALYFARKDAPLQHAHVVHEIFDALGNFFLQIFDIAFESV